MSMEETLLTLIGNYDRLIDQPTSQPTDGRKGGFIGKLCFQ